METEDYRTWDRGRNRDRIRDRDRGRDRDRDRDREAWNERYMDSNYDRRAPFIPYRDWEDMMEHRRAMMRLDGDVGGRHRFYRRYRPTYGAEPDEFPYDRFTKASSYYPTSIDGSYHDHLEYSKERSYEYGHSGGYAEW